MPVTYDIRRSPTGAATWTVIAEGISADYLVDEGLAANASYDYQIRACNEFGCSGWSATVTVTIPEEPAEPTIWYNLRRSLEGANDWTVIATDLTLTAYLDTLLSGSTGYDYQVQACNQYGCSDWSASVTVVTLPGPARPPVDLDFDGTVVWQGEANVVTPAELAFDGASIWQGTADITTERAAVELAFDGQVIWQAEARLLVPISFTGDTIWQGQFTLDVGTGLEFDGRVIWQGEASLQGVPVLLAFDGAAVWQGTARLPALPLSFDGAVVWRASIESTGPGSGFVVEGYIDYWQELKAGDWLPVIFDYAGVSGLTGLARIMSISFSDSNPNPQLQLYIVPQVTQSTSADIAELLPSAPAELTDDAIAAIQRHNRQLFELEQT